MTANQVRMHCIGGYIDVFKQADNIGKIYSMVSAVVYVAAYAPMHSSPFSLENHSCYLQVCARNYRFLGLRWQLNFIKTKKPIE